MKKFLELSSWSRKAAIGSMLIMAFAFVGCDDSSSASAGSNDEPGVESSSVAEHSSSSSSAQKNSSSSEKAKQSNSSSSVNPISSSNLQGDKNSSSSGEKETSSSSAKSESSSSDENSQSSSSEVVVNSSSSVSGASSSSLNFDWSLPKETYLNPEIEYDTIIDSRDGKVYKTVKIGDQTWMVENLNYADSVKTASLKDKSWCYDNVAKNCDVAGRLYTWAAAIDSVKLATDVENSLDCGYGKTCDLASAGSATLVQGICPTGWHLPSQAEWNVLFTAVGGQSTAGKVLKSQSGWFNNGNGTDAYGFSALPAGYRYDYSNFFNEGINAFFWSSTERSRLTAYSINLNYINENAYLNKDNNKYNGFSVRCVKD